MMKALPHGAAVGLQIPTIRHKQPSNLPPTQAFLILPSQGHFCLLVFLLSFIFLNKIFLKKNLFQTRDPFSNLNDQAHFWNSKIKIVKYAEKSILFITYENYYFGDFSFYVRLLKSCVHIQCFRFGYFIDFPNSIFVYVGVTHDLIFCSYLILLLHNHQP